MTDELTVRSKQVLKLVIEEYIVTAKPVGSGVLREKYRLPVSPATLRNEMAELERRGYLTHLHTSGGRVPSESGYRLFVESLMGRGGISPADMRRVEHQFHQVEGDMELDRWAELAASVLAQLARNAALVTTPRGAVVELRRIHLIHLNEGTALAVAVMDDGSARQAVCILPYAASQEELGSVATALNAALAGLTVVNMAERLSSLHGPAADIAPQVVGMLGRDGSRSAVSQSGLLAMLHQPEFQVGDTARRVVELLEGGSLLAGLAERVAAEPGVHVIIGSENGLVEMSDCTVVTAAYTSQNGGYGLLTVVGPTRMHYERTISSVFYVSQLLSRMLHAND